MKTTRLFFVMAMAASLIACTKEVLVEPEKAVESFDEIKGAKLLANGFSVDPTLGDPMTKIGLNEDGTGADWSKGDQVGIGWFVSGAVDSEQTEVELNAVTEKAYANHKLTHNGKRFESNSNVYEGWHIAYHPYAAMARPGQLTGFVVNPPMTEKVKFATAAEKKVAYGLEQMKNTPMFSAAQFVGETDVEDGVIVKDFALKGIVNTVRPTFTVEQALLDEDVLSDLQIESIKLQTNRPFFLNTLSVNPQYFPADEEPFSADHFGLSGKAFTDAAYVSTITTDLNMKEGDEYTLGGGDLNFRFFMAPLNPAASTVAYNKIHVIVNLVGGSYFDIYYDATPAEADSNYDNILKLQAALNGTLTNAKGETFSLKTLQAAALGLEFELRKEDFNIDYIVDGYEAWEENVKLAKATGDPEPIFQIKSDVTFPAGPMEVGADENGENALNITVKPYTAGKRVNLVFDDETSWSPNVKVSSYIGINVIKTDESAGKLTVDVDLNPSYATIDEGATVILKGENSKLRIGNSSNFVNNGIIEVSRQSVVKEYTGSGKVVYNVESEAKASDIDHLKANAQLTDLVVNNDWTVEGAADWGGVAVELNNADVTFAAGATLKNITVTGESTITGNVAGDLVVVEGATLTVDGDINGNVNVFGTATINATKISGDLIVTERAKEGEVKPSVTLQSPYGVMTIGDITNYATLNVETDVYAADVETGSDSYTEIKTGFTLYYSGSKVQDGTVKGKLEAGTIDSGAGYEKIGDVFFVNAEAGLNAAFTALTAEDIKPTIVLQAPVTLTAGNLGGVEANEVITIDANGNEITFGETAGLCVTTVADGVKLVINDATVNKANYPSLSHGEELMFDCEVEFNNVTFTTNLQLRKDAVLNNVHIYPEKDVYALYTPNYGQTITLNDCEIKGTRGIKICEVGFDGLGYDEGKVTYSINNTIFETTGKKAAVLVRTAEGADIYWNVNNNIDKVAADDALPVWLDSEAPSSYTNAVNVYKVDGENVVLDNTLRGFED